MTDEFDTDLRERMGALAAAVPVESPRLTTEVRPRIRSGSMGRRLALGGLIPVLALVIIGTVIAGVAKVGPFAPAATGTLPDTTEEPNGPVTITVTEGPFELTIRSAKVRYQHDEAIEIEAVLAYRGSEPAVEISHGPGADGGPLAFGIKEPIPVDGGDLGLFAGYPSFCLVPGGSPFPCPSPAEVCIDTMLEQGAGSTLPFEKRVHAGSDIPAGDGAVSYLRDPILHLPPGTWHPYVIAEFSLGEARPCTDYALRAEIEVQVVDAPIPPTAEPMPSASPRSSRSDLPTDGPSLDPVVESDVDGPYSLELRSARGVYHESDVIDISAAFTYSGNVPIDVRGFSPLVFGIAEPVYGIDIQGIVTLACSQATLEPGERIEGPFQKGGAVSSSDPEREFKRAYLMDPILRLPPGTWHIRVGGSLYEDDCGKTERSLSVEIEIVVLPDGEPGATGSPATGTEIHLRTASAPSKGCYQAFAGGQLAVDLRSGLGVILANGEPMAVMWPFGYTARLEAGGAVLIDPEGQVVAREGDAVGFTGSPMGDGAFFACSGIRVVES